MPRYEAHITADIQHAQRMRATGEELGWKYSQIHGCPIMGDKTYCYLTSYNRDAQTLLREMNAIITTLEINAVPVLRSKIERIIYDTKTQVNELAEVRA